jgi:16S rRNA (guanine966-N2)-methyltransferase
MSIKIIAGQYGGTSITIPKSARPTLSRYRQTLFDILAAREQSFFYEKVVLDCFAGSGALGIEAISRGAAYAYFVDNSKEAVSAIMSNINKLKITEHCTVIRSDVMQLPYFYEKHNRNNSNNDCNDDSAGTNMQIGCDIAFLDPPYFDNGISIEQVVNYLLQSGWISTKTIIVIEQSSLIKDQIRNLDIFLLKKTGKSKFIIATAKL